MKMQINRCAWAGNDPLYVAYHDTEWGKPIHDDRLLFEFLILEGMQAGLSWITILKKREAFRAAFENFEPEMVAVFEQARIEELMQNSAIVRNRRKIESAVKNARHFLEIQKKFGSFDKFIWSYVDGEPIVNHPKTSADVPATSELSDRISRDLKKLGFSFVGSTIIYSFMQATGMVNDHIDDCDFK